MTVDTLTCEDAVVLTDLIVGSCSSSCQLLLHLCHQINSATAAATAAAAASTSSTTTTV